MGRLARSDGDGARLARIPWWAWFPSRRIRLVATATAADEVPVRLPKLGAVVVGEGARQQWLILDCPACRGRHRLMLNLASSRRPRWTVSGRRRITVSPSVDATPTEGRCHFWIRNGRVVNARHA